MVEGEHPLLTPSPAAQAVGGPRWESLSEAPTPHNWGADAAVGLFAQTQVVPPATSSWILDHPTITFGPETICWVKGEEGSEGGEEEREGGGGCLGVKSGPLKFATILYKTSSVIPHLDDVRRAHYHPEIKCNSKNHLLLTRLQSYIKYSRHMQFVTFPETD